jgi:triphosphatase
MSTDANYEVEAKFLIRNPAQAARLCTQPQLLRGFALEPVETVTHRDLFLDSADFGLLRTGSALRLRHTAAGLWVTIKSLSLTGNGHLHKRLELEEPLAEDADPLDWQQWPHRVREYVAGQLGDETALQIHSALRQTRHKRTVLDKSKTPVAELSIDQVAVYALDDQPDEVTALVTLGEAAPLASFWEVEVELLPGQDEALLAQLTRPLERLRTLRPSTRSKFERTFDLVHQQLALAGAPVTAWTPAMPMADACRLVWRRQLGQILLSEAGVRYSDDPEYIHDMRVAVRRSRTALQLFGEYLRRKPLRKFRWALRQTGRRLGAVRDLDVALAKLAKQNGAEADPHQQAIADRWRAERIRAFDKLLEWLDSAEYRQFLADFARFCRTPGAGARRFVVDCHEPPMPHQVRHVLASVLVNRFAHVRAFECEFDCEPLLAPERLHALRIECKFLRYTLEFAQPLLGSPGDRLIQQLKGLQEQLGDLNDAAVSQSLLADLQAEGHEGAHSYHAAQGALIDQLRSKVATAFTDFVEPQTRRLLAQAVVRV